MDWSLVFAGIGAGGAILGANAWLMKMVIDSAITRALLTIQQDFVTKEEFLRHIDKCPYATRGGQDEAKG